MLTCYFGRIPDMESNLVIIEQHKIIILIYC
jgi:hypothetical protein